jgi:hypothetical protein
MLFGLKNAGTTYQRCMQFCFKGHNLEVYVDDIVVISQKSSSVISDLEETFNILRWFNIKLNLEKCTFRVPRASSWDTSSLSTKSKQPLTRSRPLLTWVRSGTLRTFSDSLGASQPSAVSCPGWGNVGSTCISYSRSLTSSTGGKRHRRHSMSSRRSSPNCQSWPHQSPMRPSSCT